jgi:hypothetical protein
VAPPPPAEAPPSEAPPAPAAPAAANDLGPRIAAISIAPGRDTGTPVGKTAGSLRDQVRSLSTKLVTNAHRLGEIRNTNARLITNYQDTRAQILSRLQIGTTPGNPDLVQRWNAAQTALDQLTTNLNETGTIGSGAAGDSTSAQQLLQQIGSASATPTAVDEDHRQLDALDDETRQLVISIDRLRKEVAADVPREAAFLTTERANLARLQNAIKTGQPSSANAAPATQVAQTPATAATDAKPLVTIKFESPNVDYQKTLYAALTEALKAKPKAVFEVLAVAPTASSEAAVKAVQNSAKKHARDVVQTMTAMGVPASRVAVASLTDPSIQQSEVRVFVR